MIGLQQNTIYDSFSLESILGIIFAPLMWIMGVPTPDIMPMGQLLGVKQAASEFVGYIQLAELKDPTNIVHLQYQKSIIMATYMLCGFANFASIGIQIGGIDLLRQGNEKYFPIWHSCAHRWNISLPDFCSHCRSNHWLG